MNWDSFAQTGLTALGSGGSAFFGAFLRFKQRLRECEEALKALAEEMPKLRAQYSAVVADIEAFKADYVRDLRHRQDLDDLRERERASRPDPLEDLRNDLRQLRTDIEKLKERGTRYVRSDVFAAFTKAQEDQWKEMARTLGRLEGILKQ